MLPAAAESGKEFEAIKSRLSAVVREYLTEARGAEVDDFSADTPFMDAGLDSLDMLKAGSHISCSAAKPNFLS